MKSYKVEAMAAVLIGLILWFFLFCAGVESDCLELGYPNYRVSLTLEGYCATPYLSVKLSDIPK